jgi:acetyl-CoA C-acetyltransferase
MMKTVYLVNALRTPFGSFGGALADVPAPQLAAGLIGRLLDQESLEPASADEVILGQVLSGGAGQAPARQAMRLAGVSDKVPAMTINKVCGSGLKAIMLAAGSIRLGDAEVVIAGGMENMSMAPYALPGARFGMRMGPGAAVDLLLQDALIDPYSVRHMGEITEDLIASYGITRREQDAWAVRSYERAQAAVKTGLFAEEIVPVRTLSKKGEMTVAEDEEPFRVDFEKFASLRPVFKKDGTITAANASTINDGAALALLAGEAAVGHFGLQPLARLVAYATHSLHPDRFGEAPVGAIDRVCALAGLQVSDIGLFEINEAFAAVPLMAVKRLGLGVDKVNVNGGAVALGHPVGASGGRLVATLARELRRRSERYGLATLCIGGGEAVAAIFERI